MIYHGIVVNMEKNKAIVSTSDFQCFYIKRSPASYVGKHVDFTEKEIIRKRSTLAKLALSAACITILFFIASISNFLGITNIKSILFKPKVFAYVDVDINPSMEIGIDNMGNVLRVLPINGDAKVLVKKIKLGKVSISQAIDVLIGETKKIKVVSEDKKDYVLVSSTLNNQKNETDKEYQVEKEKLDKLMNSLKDNIQNKENGKVIVFLVQANVYERKDARSKGISTGRYVLYKKYKNLSNNFSIEEAKRISVNELLKGIQNIQAEEDSIMATPELTHSPLKEEFNTQNGFSTPNNKLLKNNFTKEPNIKLITPTPLIPLSLTPSPTIQIINSTFVKFESYNFPGYFIRHESFKGCISENVTPVEDSEFELVHGLADSKSISFESKNFPGYYLIHENFKIVLKKYDDSVNYRECATFRKIPGLADINLISFQSYNYPKRYIRHIYFHLQIDEIVSDLEKEDATFTEIKVD